MKKKVKRFCKVFACALSIMVVMVLGFAVSAEETITDLTGTEWSWNIEDYPDFVGLSNSSYKHVNFVSNEQDFTSFLFYHSGNTTSVGYIPNTPDGSVWFWDGAHLNSKSDYQTFLIVGGDDVQDSALITWITSNCTQVIHPEPEPDVFSTISTFLSGCLSLLGSVVTYATENAVLTIFMFGIAVISFSIGVLRRLLNTRG